MNKKKVLIIIFSIIGVVIFLIILGVSLIVRNVNIEERLYDYRKNNLESEVYLIINLVERENLDRFINNEEKLAYGKCEKVFDWDINNGNCTFFVENDIVTVTIIGEGNYLGLRAKGNRDDIKIVDSNLK